MRLESLSVLVDQHGNVTDAVRKQTEDMDSFLAAMRDSGCPDVPLDVLMEHYGSPTLALMGRLPADHCAE